MRRLALAVLVLLVAAPSAHAQWIVSDPQNLVQTILIATRTEQHYRQLLQELQIVQRMAQGLGALDRYRIPALTASALDPARWDYGRTWLQGLANGDPTGALYLSGVLPLQPTGLAAAPLSAAARRAFERRLATVEISDAVALSAGNQVALTRSYQDRLDQAVAELQRDVLSRGSGYRDMTAILDKIAAGELLARRQDMAGNQLLSHVLEQMLARSKRLRDTEAATLNMQLVSWRDGRALNDAFVAGTGDALRTWRQR